MPLYDGKDNYNKVRQGKAMELWSILYQHYGPSFMRWVFVQTTKGKTISVKDITTYMRTKLGVSKPERMLSGWVIPGRYYYKSHKLRRPRYQLP